MSKTHELKTLPFYFKEVETGRKTFELRKNDRDFHAGDVLILKEYNDFEGKYTGKEITKKISYILNGGQYGLEKGYCILALNDK